MNEWWLRLRAIADAQFSVVLVVLLVLTAGGGWLSYSPHVDPGTHTEERRAGEWTVSGTVEHGATVVRNNSVFPVGARLTNRSRYYTRIAPVLNGTYVVAFAASDTGDLAIDADLDLVYRSVARDEDRNEVFWRLTTDLHERNGSSLSPGDTARIPFQLNASKVYNRTEQIREDLGDRTSEIQTLVVANVTVSGTANGRAVSRSFEHAVPLRITDSTYSVQSERTERGGSTTERVTVTNTFGPLRRFGGPAVLTVGLLGILGLLWGRYRGSIALSAAEREYLAYRDDRSDFDEWISRIRLPAEAFDRPRAEADSLGDLVDLAIDSDTAVVEDPDDETCYVVHGDYLYVYEPPPDPTGGAGSTGTAVGVEDRVFGPASDTESQDPATDGAGTGDGHPDDEGDGPSKDEDSGDSTPDPEYGGG